MAPRTWRFDIHTEYTDRVLILRLTGRLDRASVSGLREALATATTSGVLVDLGGLDYISGPGLAAFQEAAGRAGAAGRPFVLCGLEESVRIAFDLAGLLQVLAIEPDRTRGIARVLGG
jgi:stage II sporulation protein AA (anti-sigma F factor antagonist)